VPIAAKVLNKHPNEYSFGNGDNPIIITLGLPFSWEILYFMALSFGIATFIYSYKCPDLLKKFSSWDKFNEKGLGKKQLLVYFSNWLRNYGQIREAGGKVVPQIKAVNTVAKKFCSTLPPHLKDIKEAWYLSKYLPINKEKEIDAFWYIKALMHNDGKA